jgi:hypothetical protein
LLFTAQYSHSSSLSRFPTPMSSRQQDGDGICAPAAKHVSKNVFVYKGYESSLNTERSTYITRPQRR